MTPADGPGPASHRSDPDGPGRDQSPPDAGGLHSDQPDLGVADAEGPAPRAAGLSGQARRELVVAVVLAVAGGALAFYAASRTWTVTETLRPAPLPAVRAELTGRDSVPWAAAMSLVALAGGLALLAVRRVVRAIVGVALGLTGLVIVSGGLTGGLTAGAAFQSVQTNAAWPATFIGAGIAVLISSGVVLMRGGHWTAIGARYDRDRGPTDAGVWDALDRGEDPTG